MNKRLGERQTESRPLTLRPGYMTARRVIDALGLPPELKGMFPYTEARRGDGLKPGEVRDEVQSFLDYPIKGNNGSTQG